MQDKIDVKIEETTVSIDNISINISLDQEVEEFIEKKKIKEILFDCEFLQEPCTEIFSPIISFDSKNKINEKCKQKNLECQAKTQIINNREIKFYFTKVYLQKFHEHKEIELIIKGRLGKHIEIKNIEPIIIDTCHF